MQHSKPQNLGVEARFQAYSYLCFPQISNYEALDLQGDCIIPLNFMITCAGVRYQGPMSFRVTSENPPRMFCTTMQTAEELNNIIILPSWRMQEAGINNGEIVSVAQFQLPPASFVALSPANLSILSLPSPVDSLRIEFDQLGAIFQDEEITVHFGGSSYTFKVVEMKPCQVAHVKFTGDLEIQLRWSPELQARINGNQSRERNAPAPAPALAAAPAPDPARVHRRVEATRSVPQPQVQPQISTLVDCESVSQAAFNTEYSVRGLVASTTVDDVAESFRFIDLHLNRLSMAQVQFYHSLLSHLATHTGNTVLRRAYHVTDSRCVRLMFTNLPTLTEATQLTPQQRVQVVQDVAREVASLHQSGFLLGTINPEQILVANVSSDPRGMLWAFKDPCTRDQADNYTAADTSFYRGINPRKSAAGDVQALGMLLVYAIDPILPPTIANIRGTNDATKEVNRQEAGADHELANLCSRCLDPAASTPTANDIVRVRVAVTPSRDETTDEGEKTVMIDKMITEAARSVVPNAPFVTVNASNLQSLLRSLDANRNTLWERTVRGVSVNGSSEIDLPDASATIQSVQHYGAGLGRLVGVCLVQRQTIATNILDAPPVSFALEALCEQSREYTYDRLERLHAHYFSDTHAGLAAMGGYTDQQLVAAGVAWNDRKVTSHNCKDYLRSYYETDLEPYIDFARNFIFEFGIHWPALMKALSNQTRVLRRKLGHLVRIDPRNLTALLDGESRIKQLVTNAILGMTPQQLALLSNFIWNTSTPHTRINVVRGRDGTLPTMQTCSGMLTLPMASSADSMRNLIDQTLMHENPDAEQLRQMHEAEMARLRNRESREELQRSLANCETHKSGDVSFPAIRLCPKCSITIFHSDACNHMTCAYCKHEFCMRCLGTWNQQCNQSRCHSCRLAPTQQVHDDDSQPVVQDGVEQSSQRQSQQRTRRNDIPIMNGLNNNNQNIHRLPVFAIDDLIPRRGQAQPRNQGQQIPDQLRQMLQDYENGRPMHNVRNFEELQMMALAALFEDFVPPH